MPNREDQERLDDRDTTLPDVPMVPAANPKALSGELGLLDLLPFRRMVDELYGRPFVPQAPVLPTESHFEDV